MAAKRIENATTGQAFRFDGKGLSAVKPDPQIARWEDFNEDKVKWLMEQFTTIGQKIPVLIRRVNNEVRVVEGRNRLEAANRVHLIEEANNVPPKQRFRLWAVEQTLDDTEALIASLAGNSTQPTSAVDLASAASKLSNSGMNQSEIAATFQIAGLKITQSRVSKLLKIHAQPHEIKKMIARGQLTEAHLGVLISTAEAGNMTAEEMPIVANKILAGEIKMSTYTSALNKEAREGGKGRTRSIADLYNFLKERNSEKSQLLLSWMKCDMSEDDPPQEVVKVTDLWGIFDD